ncbi:hypothetical protein AMECASPLE_038762 [Ameca splendens]|uniref:Uncharacterized protein n=1 Tax=Ameca splendens TaxID=208324 RepID=A0ABV0YVD2_9TELE
MGCGGDDLRCEWLLVMSAVEAIQTVGQETTLFRMGGGAPIGSLLHIPFRQTFLPYTNHPPTFRPLAAPRISEKDVNRLFQCLKTKKATGPDYDTIALFPLA